MSQVYYVVCMDCGEWQDAGRSLRIRDPLLQKDLYVFSNLSDGHKDDYSGFQATALQQLRLGWRYVVHFLVRHRGHELRVLPESLVGPYETAEMPAFTKEYIAVLNGAPEETYYLSATGIPDQCADSKEVPDKVVRRLEELSRGENIKTPAWKDEA